MSEIDTVLDEALEISETETSYTPPGNAPLLIVNEPSRTITYDSKSDLVLGVKGDRFAERIYFKCPKYVYTDGSEVIDLTADTTKIYINYSNTIKEPYIEECAKNVVDATDYVVFSWFLSEYVTIDKGTVTFNVCVKDESTTLTDSEGNTIVQEWHTTIFKGIVLEAIDVSDKTPEVITSDTVTTTEIIDAMNSYQQEVATLNSNLSDTDAYIDQQIDVKMAEDYYTKDDVYTKTETDALVNVKADSVDVYTKSEIDSKLEDSVNRIIKVVQNDNGTYTVDPTSDLSSLTADTVGNYVVNLDSQSISGDVILHPIRYSKTVNDMVNLFSIDFSNTEMALRIIAQGIPLRALSVTEIQVTVPDAENANYAYKAMCDNYGTEIKASTYDTKYTVTTILDEETYLMSLDSNDLVEPTTRRRVELDINASHPYMHESPIDSSVGGYKDGDIIRITFKVEDTILYYDDSSIGHNILYNNYIVMDIPIKQENVGGYIDYTSLTSLGLGQLTGVTVGAITGMGSTIVDSYMYKLNIGPIIHVVAKCYTKSLTDVTGTNMVDIICHVLTSDFTEDVNNDDIGGVARRICVHKIELLRKCNS